ncbi:MAG: AraC family transcriptional regulator [Verrucomicrobiota bacterium]
MKPTPIANEAIEEARSAFLAELLPGQIVDVVSEALSDILCFVKDRESRFMGGNLAFAQTLGETSIASVLGKTDYEFSPDFLADAFYTDDQKVMSTGEVIRNRIELVPASDGSLDWFCTTKIPLRSAEGEVIGLFGYARIIRDTDTVYANYPEMHKIVDFVRANYRKKISVSDMASVSGISVSSQERLFRKTFGLTPLMYLRKTRLNAACKLLRDTNRSLAAIAVDCGFNDQTNMTRAFRLELKITPMRYRRRFSE